MQTESAETTVPLSSSTNPDNVKGDPAEAIGTLDVASISHEECSSEEPLTSQNNQTTSSIPPNQSGCGGTDSSPMAQGCYNSRFCCPMTQHHKITVLLRTLFAFSIIELICLPKYLILPIVVIQLLGGPIVLILPWCLLLFVIWSLQLVACTYTDCASTAGLDPRDLPPPSFEVAISILSRCGVHVNWSRITSPSVTRGVATHGEVGRSPFVTAMSERQMDGVPDMNGADRHPSVEASHIEFGVPGRRTYSMSEAGSNNNNGNNAAGDADIDAQPSIALGTTPIEPRTYEEGKATTGEELVALTNAPGMTDRASLIRLTVTNGEFIAWTVACILDIALSAFSITVCLILLIVCLTEADGLVVLGYQSQYAAIVAETIFCFLSIIARVGFICVMSYLRCNLPHPRTLCPWLLWQTTSSSQNDSLSSVASTTGAVVSTDHHDSTPSQLAGSTTAGQWYYAISRNSIIYRGKVGGRFCVLCICTARFRVHLHCHQLCSRLFGLP